MFAISTRGIPGIHSFNRAREVWNNADTWKDERYARPLDSKRMRHKAIVLSTGDAGDQRFALRLYDTEMVEYFEDGVVLRCDDRVSSSAFSWCVRPGGCRPVKNRGKMFWQVETPDGVRYYRDGVGPIQLKKADEDRWVLIDGASPQTEVRIDRKKSIEARRIAKPYAQWYEVTKRLLGPEFTPRSNAKATWAREPVQCLIDKPDHIEMFGEIARTAGDPHAVIEHLLDITGARVVTPVPFDRMPRIQR